MVVEVVKVPLTDRNPALQSQISFRILTVSYQSLSQAAKFQQRPRSRQTDPVFRSPLPRAMERVSQQMEQLSIEDIESLSSDECTKRILGTATPYPSRASMLGLDHRIPLSSMSPLLTKIFLRSLPSSATRTTRTNPARSRLESLILQAWSKLLLPTRA